MRSKFLILFAMVILVTSCARIVDVFERPVPPDEALFASAEGSFAAADYDRALRLYQEYLKSYPDGPMAPGAMLKIGMIRTEAESYDAARAMFGQLMEAFPDTDAARWAQVETLFSYFRENRYDAAIDYGATLEASRFPGVMRARINRIIGDVFMAKASYQEAFSLFLAAFADTPEEERIDAGMRLMNAASHLDPEDLDAAIAALEGRAPAGYLLFQKGRIMADAGRIGDAITVLSAFVETYPEHVFTDAAVEKLTHLQSMAYFEGHRIGVLLPLSGPYATFGRNALRGIELALAQYSGRYNADPPLEILVHDTGGDPEQTAQAVRDLSGKKVAAIVGPIVMAEVAAQEAQKMGIPIITLTQRPDIQEAGEYVFRNFLTPKMQVEALVSYTTGTLGLTRFAILYPDEAYGETFLHLFWDELIEHGGIVVGVEKYSPEKTDFSDPIKKLVGLYYDVPERLKGRVLPVNRQLFPMDLENVDGELPGLVGVLAENAAVGEDPWDETAVDEDKAIVDFDAVFIPDRPAVAGLIIPQLRYYDISDAYLLGTNLWHSQRLIDIAGRQLRKVVIPEGFYGKSQKASRFVSQFEGIYGDTPGIIEASGYDSAMMLFEVITTPGIDNRVAVKNALLTMPPFDGVTGSTVFDETGDAVKDLYLLEVVRGGFSEIRK